MDCLVTKLKGTVNDSDLMKLGELRIKFDMSTEASSRGEKTHMNFYFLPTKVETVSVIGNGYIGTSDEEVSQKTIAVSADDATTIYLSDDVEEISISDKYAIKKFSMRYTRDAALDINNAFDFSDISNGVEIYLSQMRGDVSKMFKNLKSASSERGVFALYAYSPNTVKDLYGDFTEAYDRLAAINPSGISYFNLSAPNVTGQIKTAPANIFIANSKQVTIDFDNLDISKITSLYISDTSSNSNVVLKGDVSNLMGLSKIGISHASNSVSEISGDLMALFSGRSLSDTKMIKLSRTKSSTVQDLSKLHDIDNITVFSNYGSDENCYIPCTWSKNGYQGQYIIALESVYMQSHTEDMLVDMATKNVNPAAAESYEKTISIRALDLESATENITSAISTLSGKGVTVSITYLGGARALSLARAASKYAIVYKGDELIVEPTDLRHATVSAAYDCTYKEFNSLEEANAYVSNNGLVRTNS